MTYSQRYVAFLDILGFSETVKTTEHDEARLEGLIRAIEQINARGARPPHRHSNHRLYTTINSVLVSIVRKAAECLNGS